jgi:protocatechuate 3,4-dioxygenase beta subunit
MIVGLALVLASTVSAQPGGAAPAPGGMAKGTEPLMLDFSKYPMEKFVTDGETNRLWQSLVGRQVFDGLPFLFEGRMCVYGIKMGPEKQGDTPTYPDLIGIPVGRQFEELHLIHYSQWAEAEGQEIALIRLNYADGTKHEFPILFGGHVRDWQRMASEEKERLTDSNTKIFWREPGMRSLNSTMRLFKSMLANPHPEKVVTMMDVVSTKHLASYTLVAATVANHDASRPVTPPRASDEPERHYEGALTIHVTEQGSGQPVAGALVQPGMVVDEVGMIAIPFLTSATGEWVMPYPVGRATHVWVSVEKEGYGSQNASVELEGSPTNRIEVELKPPMKLTGVVRDRAGAALAGVELALWPEWQANSKGTTADTNGHFVLAWNPRDLNRPDFELCLIARDFKRNLALAQTIDEDTTNLDLRLEPGLTVAGRATDAKGKPLAKAEAQIMFWSERMGGSLGKAIPADTDGRFEIKALPAGRRYGVNVSAKGFGRVTRNVTQEAEGRRIELEACELALADQHIAGVVLDADDQPVANVNIFGYGEGQPGVNGKTDAKGRFSFNQVCAGPIQLNANTPNGGSGSVTAQGGDTNITLKLGVRQGIAVARAASKITGTVADPEGKPAPNVRVSLFPSFSPTEKQTDSEGRFTMTFDPNQFGPMGAAQPIVVARDLTRNLAAALDLEEGATNVSVRLEPALTFAGRITDPNGKAITNAQAQALFHTERMASQLGSPVRTDAEGWFEIKGLPPGRQYNVNTSAKGFGQEQRNVEASATATNRVELEPFQLMPADQRIAGVVLDDNDKPVARAYIYSYGPKQPNLNAQTDAKGQFSLDKVCTGPIQLSANNQGGGYGNVTAEGGDTNIVIRISSARVMRRMEPPTVRLKGKPLPDLAPLGLTPEQAPADQPLLAVLIDAEQRPSRRALRLLGEQAATIKDKGVAVIVVQTGTMAEDDFKAWKQEAALAFPVGCLKGDAEKARAAWGSTALPWLILTDKAHRVTAEGFNLEELDAKLKDVGK